MVSPTEYKAVEDRSSAFSQAIRQHLWAGGWLAGWQDSRSEGIKKALIRRKADWQTSLWWKWDLRSPFPTSATKSVLKIVYNKHVFPETIRVTFSIWSGVEWGGGGINQPIENMNKASIKAVFSVCALVIWAIFLYCFFYF